MDIKVERFALTSRDVQGGRSSIKVPEFVRRPSKDVFTDDIE
jgi:hypothetical protein